MEDNGLFISSLFKKHALMNTMAQLSSVISPLICLVFVGKIFGSAGLSVIGVFTPLFFLAQFVGSIICGGSSALAAGYIARNENDVINHIYSSAVFLCFSSGVIICSVFLLFKRTIMRIFTGDKVFSENLDTYFIFFVIYFFATVIVFIPLFWSRVKGCPEIGVILTVTLTAATVAGNFILVYGFGMGIEAIALSQALATFTAYVVSTVLLHRKDQTLKFKKTISLAYCKKIFTLGSPMGLGRLYNFTSSLVLNRLLLFGYGAGAVAVYGTMLTVTRFVTAFVTGISSVIVPVVGVFNEEKDVTGIRQLFKCAAVYGNLIIGVISTGLILCRKLLGVLFGIDAGDLSMFYFAVISFAFFYMFFVNNNIFTAYYNAVSRIKLANMILFSADSFFLLIFAFILFKTANQNFVWLCYPLAGVSAMILLYFVLISIKSREKKSRDKSIKIPLLIDTELEDRHKYISFSVDNTVQAASEAASKITGFCEQNELTPKQTMMISMSIEELIVLIVNNTNASSYNPIAVRLLITDDSVVMRLRNSGATFNAIDYYEKNISGDIEKSIDILGIKYIKANAKTLYYSRSFGVNNLVIVL